MLGCEDVAQTVTVLGPRAEGTLACEQDPSSSSLSIEDVSDRESGSGMMLGLCLQDCLCCAFHGRQLLSTLWSGWEM